MYIHVNNSLFFTSLDDILFAGNEGGLFAFLPGNFNQKIRLSKKSVFQLELLSEGMLLGLVGSTSQYLMTFKIASFLSGIANGSIKNHNHILPSYKVTETKDCRFFSTGISGDSVVWVTAVAQQGKAILFCQSKKSPERLTKIKV